MSPITDEGILEAAEGITDQVLYAALHTASPPTAQNELTGGSYARVAVQPGAWHNVGAQRRNQGPITMPTPTAEWQDPQVAALWTAATGGSCLIYAPISPDVAAPTVGNPVSFPAGQFVIGTGLGTEVSLSVSPPSQSLRRGGSVSAQLTARGGSGAYRYSRKSGPTWVNVDTSTGRVTGNVPVGEALGTVSAVLTVQDSAGASADVTFTLTVQAVGDPVSARIQPASLGARRNERFSAQVVAAGGSGVYTYSKQAGVPSWVTIDSAGGIAGLVPRNQPYGQIFLDFVVTDDEGGTDSATLTVNVAATPGTLSIVANPNNLSVKQGEKFQGQLTATGGTGKHRYSVKTQPSGWAVNVSSLSGQFSYTVPSSQAVGPQTVTFSVTDGVSTADAAVTVNVQATAVPLSAAASPATQEVNVSGFVEARLTANGGKPVTATIRGQSVTGGYTWTKVSGPSWLGFLGDGTFGPVPGGPVSGLETVNIGGRVPGNAERETHTAVFRATDASTPNQTYDVTVRVTVADDPVILAFPPTSNPQFEQGATISIASTAEGGDGSYTYSKVSGPTWIDIGNDGRVAGTVPNNATPDTLIKCIFRVTDGDGATSDARFDFTVVRATDLTSVPSQDSTKDFNLHTSNRGPYGAVYAAGTLYVPSSTLFGGSGPQTVFAYDVDSNGVPVRNSAKDLDYSTLNRGHLYAIFSDGTTLWLLTRQGSRSVYATHAFTLQANSAPIRNAARDFAIDSALRSPRGATVSGNTAWIINGRNVAFGTPNAFAYDISGTGAPQRATTLDFDLDESIGTDPRYADATNDGKTLYIVCTSGQNAFTDTGVAYSIGGNQKPQRRGSKDFDFVAANTRPQGIATNGTTIWVIDTSDAKGYGYAI